MNTNCRLFTAVVGLVLVIALACRLPAPPGPTPTPSPARQAQVLLVLDCSSSYPLDIFNRAKTAMADLLATKYLTPGSGGARVWSYCVGPATRHSAIEDPFVIPAVDATPAPPDNSNPVDPRPVETYRQQHTDAQNSLAAAKEKAQPKLDALRQFQSRQLPGSDLGAVWQLATDLFRGQTGPRIVIVASDLQPYGFQDYADLDLKGGVKVRAIYHYCEREDDCIASQNFWLPILKAAGAADVQVLAPDAPLDGVLD